MPRSQLEQLEDRDADCIEVKEDVDMEYDTEVDEEMEEEVDLCEPVWTGRGQVRRIVWRTFVDSSSPASH